MSQLQVITRQRHLHKRWQPLAAYAFAARDSVIALVAAELPRASIAMATGFVKYDAAFIPVALTGFPQAGNVFIDAAGRWTGAYLPAALRGFPFQLVKNPENDQQVLCIDEASGQVTDGPEGEAFFTPAGAPAQPVQDMLNFLLSVATNRTATQVACAALARHGVIRPWAVSLPSRSDEPGQISENKVGGLFEVDEAALNQLSGDALKDIALSGGLQLAYCQLLSRLHLPALAQRVQERARSALPVQAVLPMSPADLDLAYLRQADTISFANLF